MYAAPAFSERRRYATMATGFTDALTALYDAGAFRKCEDYWWKLMAAHKSIYLSEEGG